MTNKIYIESPESERKYRKLAALGKELGVPVPQVFLEMKVTMPDGKVVHHHKQRAHSWCRNAYNILVSNLMAVNLNDNTYEAGKLSVKDTGGTVQFGTYPFYTDNDNQLNAAIGYTAAAASNASGIVVGSNAGAESFEDFKLLTLIANGNGAGQLAYAASSAYVVAYVAGTHTLSVTCIRYMNNNSAGGVDVNEVALIMHGMHSAIQHYIWVNSRDHLGATVTVPATGQLKVTYVISLVYPA